MATGTYITSELLTELPHHTSHSSRSYLPTFPVLYLHYSYPESRDQKQNTRKIPQIPPPQSTPMAPRRSSTRGGRSAQPSARRTPARVRKNTRSRQPPNRYGHAQSLSNESPATVSEATSDMEEVAPSTPEYSHSPNLSSNTMQVSRSPPSQPPAAVSEVSPSLPSVPETLRFPPPSPETPLNMDMMRELLRSHEQDIVYRVFQQLSTENALQNPSTYQNPPRQILPLSDAQPPLHNPIHTRMAELENQLAQLRAQDELEQPLTEPNPLTTLFPTHSVIPTIGESRSGVSESVKSMFPGVERSTLGQIIENRFKPTNIYRLLASEEEREETHPTINIGGIEFEQAEREGKESEYHMSSFFKAWAAYSGIIIKLAPMALQGELATALCIYTMNIYELLEKYTWDGVKAYHFQFHHKRVAGGKNLYHPQEWCHVDAELVTSKCFAHPIPRPSWPQNFKPAATQAWRTFDLPIRESPPSSFHSNTGHSATYPHTERRANYPHTAASTGNMSQSVSQPAANGPPCRNWNHRDCHTIPCRYQHSCIICSGSHQAPQCTTGNKGLSHLPCHGLHTC